MKFYFLISFIIFSSIVYCQDNNKLYCDTIERIYCESNDPIISITSYGMREGVNKIIDTTDNFVMIGTAKERFSLRLFLTVGRGKEIIQVGLWSYYCNNILIGYKSFDKKGKILGRVELYDNGQVMSIDYRYSSKVSFEYSKEYFKDGTEVNPTDNLKNWLETKENCNCSQNRDF